MHPNSYQKLINNDRGNELKNIKFLPILNNNKISDFDKWLKIRRELVTIKIKNVINHGIFKMNIQRILIQPEQVNPNPLIGMI